MATIHHSIVVGQSLATGQNGTPALSPGSQANNRLRTFNGSGVLVPLTNSVPGVQLPERTLAERAWPSGDYEMSINTHAEGGRNYTQLKKGTQKYNEALASIAAGYAALDGDSLLVEAMHVIHGESDQGEGTTRAQYITNLNEWRTDFQTDIAAITGQSGSFLHEILCQTGGNTAGTIAHAQLQAHRESLNTWLATPTYHILHGDGVHLTNVGYYILGEYLGKAHRKVVIDKARWEPLHPTSITMTGRVVTAVFNVPVGPMVFDTSTIAQQVDMGFQFTDDAGNHDFDTVQITSANTIVMTLHQDPVGSMRRLTYNNPGNLRDSDPSTSAYDGSPLYNWCCLFQEDIPFVAPQKPLITQSSGRTSGISAARRLRLRV